MRIFNKGFNFKQDGPGNRLVYHLSGCNMRCIWCANPESFLIDDGKEVSVKDVFDECVRSKAMFFSGGGVTFTGGEATIQHKELLTLLKALKSENIHTALETNGTDKNLQELLEYVDYLIMDFKHYDKDMLKKYTGGDIEVIKFNFETNCDKKRFQHIRIPLINGINTDNPRAFCQYFSACDTSNTVFEFLPYHEFGKKKWITEYKVNNGFIDEKILKNFYDTFREFNLKIIRT